VNTDTDRDPPDRAASQLDGDNDTDPAPDWRTLTVRVKPPADTLTVAVRSAAPALRAADTVNTPPTVDADNHDASDETASNDPAFVTTVADTSCANEDNHTDAGDTPNSTAGTTTQTV
jgi:hypothetical protein